MNKMIQEKILQQGITTDIKDLISKNKDALSEETVTLLKIFETKAGKSKPSAKQENRTRVCSEEQINKEVKIFIDYHHDKFLEKFGFKPTIYGGKDASLIKKMLKKVDLETLKLLHAMMLESNNSYIKRLGYSINALYYNFDSLMFALKKGKHFGVRYNEKKLEAFYGLQRV